MTTTKTTNNDARVDFFKSARTLSTRVAEYFRVVIKKEELRVTYSTKIQNNINSIAGIDDALEKGTKLDVTKEELEKMRENYVSMNESLQNEWDNLVEEQANFELTGNDKKFRKAVKNAKSIDDLRIACRAFFREYKLVIDNTTFESALIESIGKRIDKRTVVTSGGTKCMNYDSTNALKNMYGVSFEWMVEAGTIKNADIPSVLVDKYAKKDSKKGKKKAKKETVKAENK